MVIAATEPAAAQTTRSRWALAYAWTAGLIGYCIAILLTTEHAAGWINDAAWTLTSAVALLYCFHASRHVEPERRAAWRWLGCACATWFAGQLHWDYSQLVLGVSFPFPSIGQVMFSLFAVFAVVGI